MSGIKADILIVDDLPENLLALETILSDLSHNIVRASSGQEALRILLDRDFAVILLDVRMPEMDGIETAQYIRKGKRSRLTPIIFITAGDDNVEAVARAYSAGAVDFIQKPIQSEVLRSKVRVFIDLYLKGKELGIRAEELLHANEELRAAYKQLETFSYTIAHELRAPLRAMTGYSQILREEYTGKAFDQVGQQYALRIEASAKAMDDLIRELIAYCQIAHANIKLVKVDPETVIQDVLMRSTPALRERCRFPEGGPFPPIVADRNLLSHVITNLISNAGKFVKPESQPDIRINYEARGEDVRLWIEDNGIGIPREHHERIFRTFERLHDRADFPGAGMGLAVVKTAMERMGGRVGLESEPGKGARFWIELPRYRGA